ncbi:hypothetical protein [uncultured Clostridium sp.]|uniref:hypothetical protein n=1 Tax=uncultured Clostridium sp. TaxID=59620 RepID=UPI0025D66C74|nr:hypothetical protein [uncultured Clostridium sp.]
MSNLINKTGLKKFADGFWTKIKGRYDNAFVNAEIPETEKKIKFTKAGGGETKDVSLEKYARLQDRNEFEQDVSADNVAIIDNKYMGSNLGFTSNDRSLGFRQLTTNAFVDGYVDHIKIYVDKDNTSDTSTWKVWAITKGPNGKESDRVAKVILNSEALKVNSITEGTETKKFVIIPVKDSFTNETYFIARCSTHMVEVAQTIDTKYKNDVVNLNKSQPPDQENSQITWTDNATGNTAIMYLYGRESIGSLALKLRQTQADGSLYVKHSETTDGTGQGEKAGKVVKLDSNGKLNSNMLPSIAINEYIEISEFTNDVLSSKTYENGDTVVVTGPTDTGARYLCINKGGTGALTDAFIKLNDKNGLVTSVNEKTGAIVLGIASTTDKLQLKVNNEIKSEIDIISDAEINSIIASLS